MKWQIKQDIPSVHIFYFYKKKTIKNNTFTVRSRLATLALQKEVNAIYLIKYSVAQFCFKLLRFKTMQLRQGSSVTAAGLGTVEFLLC